MTAPDRIKLQRAAGGGWKNFTDDYGEEYVRADVVNELVQALEAIERGQYDGLEVTHLKAKECRDIARAALARYRGGV